MAESESQKVPVVKVEATKGTIDLDDDVPVKNEKQPETKLDQSERPPAQANTQLEVEATQHLENGLVLAKKAKATIKSKGKAIEAKNNEIRTKIEQLEDQIKREEGLAKKLKGDQVNLKAKE